MAFRLYLVTDRHQTAGRPLLAVVEAALRGGVQALQIREKDLLGRALIDLSVPLREATAQAGAALLINDRADVCRAVGADGVHLRADHLPVSVVRRLIVDGGLIGVSAHHADEARTAESDGADFVLLGPVYDTPSKRAYGPPIGARALEAAATRLSIPIFAIGGITADRVADVTGAGAWGVAVTSAILSASDPERAATALRHALEPSGRTVDRSGAQ